MPWPEIAAAMKVLLEEIEDLTVYDFWRDEWPNTDHAVVMPGEPMVDPSEHGDICTVRVSVVVRCPGTATPGEAQTALAGYLWPSGARSVPALLTNNTLGGIVSPLIHLNSGDVRLAEDTQRTWEGKVEFITATDT